MNLDFPILLAIDEKIIPQSNATAANKESKELCNMTVKCKGYNLWFRNEILNIKYCVLGKKKN